MRSGRKVARTTVGRSSRTGGGPRPPADRWSMARVFKRPGIGARQSRTIGSPRSSTTCERSDVESPPRRSRAARKRGRPGQGSSSTFRRRMRRVSGGPPRTNPGTTILGHRNGRRPPCHAGAEGPGPVNAMRGQRTPGDSTRWDSTRTEVKIQIRRVPCVMLARDLEAIGVDSQSKGRPGAPLSPVEGSGRQ